MPTGQNADKKQRDEGRNFILFTRWQSRQSDARILDLSWSWPATWRYSGRIFAAPGSHHHQIALSCLQYKERITRACHVTTIKDIDPVGDLQLSYWKNFSIVAHQSSRFLFKISITYKQKYFFPKSFPGSVGGAPVQLWLKLCFSQSFFVHSKK